MFVSMQSQDAISGQVSAFLRIGTDLTDNYYEIEKYDNFIREERAPQYDNFPASIALGALGFFLDSKLSLSKSTVFCFPQWDTMMNEVMKKKSKIKRALARTTAGYLSSTSLQKVPSYTSLEINA
jgi:hypothetical protein